MAEVERASGDEVAVRVVVLSVPIVLTGRLLSLWVPKPMAWAVSMLGWMLAVYWLPSRTDLSLRRWLIIVSASAILAFVLATLQPDMF
jgi:hypothetical protein